MKRKPLVTGGKEPPKAGRGADLSEEEALAQAMAGVVPIAKRKRVLAPAPGKRSAARQQALKPLPPADLAEGEDPPSFWILRHGAPRVVKRLRRGEFPVQEELDLHGFTQVQARRELELFLRESSRRGLRCVRVIHGKGRNSPQGLPVLRQKVPEWLTTGANAPLVSAFVSAPPRDGGTGALHILLKTAASRTP